MPNADTHPGAYHADAYLSQSCLNGTERFQEYYRMVCNVISKDLGG